MKINHVMNLYASKTNNISFSGKQGPAIVDKEDKVKIYEEYKFGEKLEDLSKKYKISLSKTAGFVEEQLILEDYLNTDKQTNEIAKKYFVTRQTVNNIVRDWGFSKEDRKGVTSDVVLAILNAQKLGLSPEEIVAKYAVKEEKV